ncbi:3-keto-disaccharide hydrolase [Flavobacterium gilvum]|uniref:3-keto-alpha-glucoside-1,2-lyase/3-keto-2-hydroxy-glucal hydratase domain-containing protein n=1 Tax=Flavobacterium gilvum TaxID=1492737 RepID=A0AAC9N5X0_9FLAO|nr:DUF1080 domain-containing protein [Flavobacterium gilvum]AOW10406.1 hypothetical protein EM308_13350 [Flavobacterium gilvum]KFC59033.1 hypothetical protein FEM08_21650 [Flavobacterium gilvum]
MKQISTIFFLFIALNSGAQSNNWQSLFDGKTLNGWKQMTGSAPYTVENGCIVGTSIVNSPNSFLVCDQKFTGDFVLEMEVMLNNANINSGIQFKSNFDSKGNKGKGVINGYQYELDPTDRKWTAGIYDESRRGWLYPGSYNPKQQQLLTINKFHKVRIECIGNTVKTWLDGLPASYLVDEQITNEGLIGLQVHGIGKKEEEGYKISWKNIRIQTKNIKPLAFPKGIYVVNKTPNNLTDYEKESGWKLLFDGKTNSGWIGAHKDAFPQKGWTIKDGILTVLSSNGGESTNGGDIVTKDEYGAFELSWDFKLTKGANSGVKYFVTLKEQVQGKSAIGLEYQLLDDTLHPDAKLGRDGNRTLASLYDLITAKKTEGKFAQPGNWNTGRIIVYPNNHVEHYLNGLKVLEYDRGSQAFRDLVAISKYKEWPNFGEALKGHILLQDHGNEVDYKNIKIRVLK